MDGDGNARSVIRAKKCPHQTGAAPHEPACGPRFERADERVVARLLAKLGHQPARPRQLEHDCAAPLILCRPGGLACPAFEAVEHHRVEAGEERFDDGFVALAREHGALDRRLGICELALRAIQRHVRHPAAADVDDLGPALLCQLEAHGQSRRRLGHGEVRRHDACGALLHRRPSARFVFAFVVRAARPLLERRVCRLRRELRLERDCGCLAAHLDARHRAVLRHLFAQRGFVKHIPHGELPFVLLGPRRHFRLNQHSGARQARIQERHHIKPAPEGRCLVVRSAVLGIALLVERYEIPKEPTAVGVVHRVQVASRGRERRAVRVRVERRLPRLAQHKDRAVVAPQHLDRLGRRHKSLVRQFLPPPHDHCTILVAVERRVRLGRAKPRAPHKTNGTIAQPLSKRHIDFSLDEGEAVRRLLLREQGATDHARDGHTKPSSCVCARDLAHQRRGRIELGDCRLIRRFAIEGLRAKHERAREATVQRRDTHARCSLKEALDQAHVGVAQLESVRRLDDGVAPLPMVNLVALDRLERRLEMLLRKASNVESVLVERVPRHQPRV